MDLQPKKKIPADKAVSVTAAFVLLAVAVPRLAFACGEQLTIYSHFVNISNQN